MNHQPNKLRTLFTVSLLILPLLSWGGINVNAANGTLQGLGHAKSHDFSVIAQQFNFTATDADTAGLRQIKATIPVKGITTENFIRNAHMRMAMFKGDFPEITFVSAVNLPELVAGEVLLKGTLTINGIAKPYDFNLTLTPDGNQWRATGSFQIIPTDFGMSLPGMGPMKVQDHVNLDLNVTF